MEDAVQTIKQYVLEPDGNGSHLRQMAERMAAKVLTRRSAAGQANWSGELDAAAEAVAGFIYLVWGDADPQEYAPRTFEMLRALQNRMRGMAPEFTWEYALDTLGADIKLRLARASEITMDPELETALLHHFFDSMDEYAYLHDVTQKIMDVHWQRRHNPDNPQICDDPRPLLVGPRGDPAVETHLRRVAIEALATYIEQSNIARGNIEKPTDPLILFRDRLEAQARMGARTAETWADSGRQLADLIESKFGSVMGRRQARRARCRWKGLSRGKHL